MNLLIITCAVGFLNLTPSFGLSNKTLDLQNLPEVKGDKFYYFGYGSNMLTKRIHIQNPTAVKIGPGELKNYRLDFNLYSSRWQGSVATVVEHVNRTVQGTLWKIDLKNLSDIDNQEGVHLGIYKNLSVNVKHLSSKETIPARVYVLVKQPPTDLQEFKPENVPFDRQPSKTYLQCLVKGAIETGIDASYIEWLKTIKHNGHV
ncbi:hypothetical protein DOY81_004238, partial [Sarcophaga bullata]